MNVRDMYVETLESRLKQLIREKLELETQLKLAYSETPEEEEEFEIIEETVFSAQITEDMKFEGTASDFEVFIDGVASLMEFSTTGKGFGRL